MPELRVIPIALIKVPEVRVSSILDEEQKALIASTIQTVGIVQDPVVRVLPDGSFELVSGLSRIREMAAQGKIEIQVKLISADEKTGLIMNIVENVARGSYDYISISQAIRRLKFLGATPEELEKIFPWRARWIEFIEQLQDLPGDVVAALKARKITPTHVQLALNLPTPYEVHDGLRTAMNLEWDTGTFRTFVVNRVEQIARAQEEAKAKGKEPEIPAAQPLDLIQYQQCLICGYKKPRDQVTIKLVCQECQDIAKYCIDNIGQSEDAIQVVYAALQMYYGARQPSGQPTKPNT